MLFLLDVDTRPRRPLRHATPPRRQRPSRPGPPGRPRCVPACPLGGPVRHAASPRARGVPRKRRRAPGHAGAVPRRARARGEDMREARGRYAPAHGAGAAARPGARRSRGLVRAGPVGAGAGAGGRQDVAGPERGGARGAGVAAGGGGRRNRTRGRQAAAGPPGVRGGARVEAAALRLGQWLERERHASISSSVRCCRRGTVEVDVLCHGVTRARLTEQVRSRGGYHLVHWSGHGRVDGLESPGRGGRRRRRGSPARVWRICSPPPAASSRR